MKTVCRLDIRNPRNDAQPVTEDRLLARQVFDRGVTGGVVDHRNGNQGMSKNKQINGFSMSMRYMWHNPNSIEGRRFKGTTSRVETSWRIAGRNMENGVMRLAVASFLLPPDSCGPKSARTIQPVPQRSFRLAAVTVGRYPDLTCCSFQPFGPDAAVFMQAEGYQSLLTSHRSAQHGHRIDNLTSLVADPTL